jgi:hypothetical protein
MPPLVAPRAGANGKTITATAAHRTERLLHSGCRPVLLSLIAYPSAVVLDDAFAGIRAPSLLETA